MASLFDRFFTASKSNGGISAAQRVADAAQRAGNVFAGTTATAEAAFDKSQMSAQQAMAFEASQAAQQMKFQREMLAQQMAYNSAQAESQRAWNREMRQTAYQDTVKDLIKAGINPILAAQLGATSIGSGATASAGTASGAMGSGHAATMQQQTVPDIIRTIGYGVTTAKEAVKGLDDESKAIANEELNRYTKRKFIEIKDGKVAGVTYR